MKQILLTILTVTMLTSCEFISNTFVYKDKTKEFVEALIKEDYNSCIDKMAMEHEMAKNLNVDTLKLGLANFRQIFINRFGSELDYKFMKSEKTFSTNSDNSTPQNTTKVQVEFSNKKEFGVFEILFDDNSMKILNINTLDIKEPIPSMTLFWLFGLLAICIPIFNIYVIILIKRSENKKKWLKYIAVAFLNVPALTYAAVNGFSFQLLNFQFLLGISFAYMGYLSSSWTFGLPLGGLYWFWKLKLKRKTIKETDIVAETEAVNEKEL